jgi:DNA-binding transcriptional LysR family regulator
MRLVEGSCDVLIAYHHPSQPNQLDADRYDMVTLGEELVAPYVKPDEHGRPLYQLPGNATRPLPYLGYAQGAYLGLMVELILKRCSAPIHFDRVYETDMAEGLKAMALEGHGIAFLPTSAVQKELRTKRLVCAAPPELKDLQITMEVRAYRERPARRDTPKSASQRSSGGETTPHNAQALWDYLLAQGGSF